MTNEKPPDRRASGFARRPRDVPLQRPHPWALLTKNAPGPPQEIRCAAKALGLNRATETPPRQVICDDNRLDREVCARIRIRELCFVVVTAGIVWRSARPCKAPREIFFSADLRVTSAAHNAWTVKYRDIPTIPNRPVLRKFFYFSLRIAWSFAFRANAGAHVERIAASISDSRKLRYCAVEPMFLCPRAFCVLIKLLSRAS